MGEACRRVSWPCYRKPPVKEIIASLSLSKFPLYFPRGCELRTANLNSQTTACALVYKAIDPFTLSRKGYVEDYDKCWWCHCGWKYPDDEQRNDYNNAEIYTFAKGCLTLRGVAVTKWVHIANACPLNLSRNIMQLTCVSDTPEMCFLNFFLTFFP